MKNKLLAIFFIIILTTMCHTFAYADVFDDSTYLTIDTKYKITSSSDGVGEYFSFTVPESGIYVFSDNGAWAENIYIYDADKKPIRKASSSMDSLSHEIIHKMEKNEVYYFSAGSKYQDFYVSLSKFDESSANWISPNEQYFKEPTSPYGESKNDYGYFCVPENGYYCFYSYGMGDICGTASIIGVSSIYANLQPTGYGCDFYAYIYYPLKKNTVYPVEITCGMNGNENTGTSYNIYMDSDTPYIKSQYKIGNILNNNTTASHTYYSLIPETSGEIYIDNTKYSDFYIYDTVSGEKTSSNPSYGNILNCSVTAGQQYYLVLTTGNFSLSSGYIPEDSNATIHTSNVEDMQSKHYYRNNLDKTWTYHAPEGTKYMDVTFSEDLYLADDTLYVYNSDGSLHSQYNRYELPEKTITVTGDTFSVRLVTNFYNIAYGFKIEKISPMSELEAPISNIPSGTMRPFTVTLSAHNAASIYYKTSYDTDYTLYTSPIEIHRDCTLYAYAKLGNALSEVSQYEYVIDNAALSSPIINIEKETDTYSAISFSISDGTVFYKKMLSDSEFTQYTSGTIYLYETDMIVAYAGDGLVKSPYVYYKREFDQNESYEITTPVITVTDITGGKRVTVTTTEALGNFYSSTNYCDNHRETQCGKNGFIHDEAFPWSTEYTSSYMLVTAGGDSQLNAKSIENGNSYTFDLYENTYISAQNHWNSSITTGYWALYMPDSGEYVEHTTSHPDMDNTTYDDIIKKSKANYLYIDIPKATPPVISVSDGKTVLSAQTGSDIYYSINGGSYVKYTSPITLSSTDQLSTYAVGSGVAKSDEVKLLSADIDTKLAIINGKISFNIKTLNKLVDKNVVVVASAYDKSGNTLLDAEAIRFTAKAGTDYIDNVLLETGNTQEVCIKLFVWDSFKTMNTLTDVKKYTVN